MFSYASLTQFNLYHVHMQTYLYGLCHVYPVESTSLYNLHINSPQIVNSSLPYLPKLGGKITNKPLTER